MSKLQGGYDNQAGYELQQTTDGGFIIGGFFREQAAMVAQFYLLKTDNQGVLQWTGDMRCESCFGKSVRQTSDGGYIMAGYDGPYEAGAAILVMKFTSTGAFSWQSNFQVYDNNAGITNQINAANCIRQTADGGYILTGYTKASTSASRTDLFLAKLTTTGSVSWVRQWEGAGGCSLISMQGKAVEQTSDGGYIIAGEQTRNNSNCFGCVAPPGCVWSEGIVIKTDASGNETWKKTISFLNFSPLIGQTFNSVKEVANGGYIATGSAAAYISTPSGDTVQTDVLLMKLSSTGNTSWIKVYGTDYNEAGYCVQQTEDDKYIVSGMHYQPNPNYEDAMLLNVDGTGQIRWAKRYGWPMTWTYKEYAYSVVETFDGNTPIGFTFAGLQQEWQMLDTSKKVYLVQTSPSGNSAECKVLDIEFDTLSFEPNPFDSVGSREAGYVMGAVTGGGDPETREDTNCVAEVWEKRAAGEADKTWTVVGGSIDLAIYPNPVENGEPLRLKYRLQEQSEVGVVITDLVGRPVYNWHGSRGIGEQQEHIVAGDWPPGWYTISISVNGIATARSMVLIQ